MSNARALLGYRFVRAYLHEAGCRRSTVSHIDRAIALKLKNFPAAEKPGTADWNMFRCKLVRFRPRLVGAVAAYTLLSGLSSEDIERNGGRFLFYLMWFLGSAQDDLIDEMVVSKTDTDIPGKIRAAIFGPDRIFYQAAFEAFIQGIENAGFDSYAQDYLKQKAHCWYAELIAQEAHALTLSLEELGFDYCKKYRESQNGSAGELLTACLNGGRCLDPALQEIERILPPLSYLTQVIDDIADVPEDLLMTRPSYAVGALVEYPNELHAMQQYIQKMRIKKVHPRLFCAIAPQSYNLVRVTLELYQTEHSFTPELAFLQEVGRGLFAAFPTVRNIIFRVSPNAANF